MLEQEGSLSQHLSKMGCEEWRRRGYGPLRLCTSNQDTPKVSKDLFGKGKDFWWQGAGSWLGSLLPLGCLGVEVPVLLWLSPRAVGLECLPHCPAASHPEPPAPCHLCKTKQGKAPWMGQCACKSLFQIPAEWQMIKLENQMAGNRSAPSCAAEGKSGFCKCKTVIRQWRCGIVHGGMAENLRWF